MSQTKNREIGEKLLNEISTNSLPRENKLIQVKIFSKKFINYTTTLGEERDDLVTFGILGRTFQLDEFIGDEATWGMFYLLISLFIGLFTTFAVIWILRIK